MNIQTMKAVVAEKYGAPNILQVKAVAKPVPKANEILVRVMATPVTAADTMLRKGTPFYGRLFIGLKKPKKPIIGTGFAGKVVAIGENVSKFKVGDDVFGETAFNFSANAEYICIAENGVLDIKPKEIPFEEAAIICDGAVTSMNFLKEIGQVKRGQHVLINGASGSLGTAAVQLAKYLGAEVTGVCSTKNVELVKSLGADKVIDYTKTDFTNDEEKYDIIYDTIGRSTFKKSKRALVKGGVYLSPVLSIPLLFQVMRTAIIGQKKAKFAATGMLSDDILRQMMMNVVKVMQLGKLRLVIDRRYALEDVVKAHQYVDSGRKVGNIVMIPI